MDTSQWAAFELDNAEFDFSAGRLEQAWPGLHAGDREPFPENPALQDAWRCFHQGDFGAAVEHARAIGIAAHAVFNKAAGIHADYLESDENARQAIYKHCMAHAEQAIEAFPEDPNAHYFHAYAMGRYSQCISIARALGEGMAGRIHAALTATLERRPEHAEAHTAMGLYHAEIIAKMGKLVGSMTYGASADKALEHFETAIGISEAPIAYIEYGNGLYLLFGDKRLEQSNACYETAAGLEALDAMQALDIEYARASLE